VDRGSFVADGKVTGRGFMTPLLSLPPMASSPEVPVYQTVRVGA